MAKHVVVYKSGGYQYIKVCKSFRDAKGKPKTLNIESHGRLDVALQKDPLYVEKLRQRVAEENEAERASRAQAREKAAAQRIADYRKLSEEQRSECYRTVNVGVAPLLQVWKLVELPQYFWAAQKRKNYDFPYAKAAFLLTERRMLEPASKVADFNSIGESIFNYSGVDHRDDLYHVLDRLAEDKTAIVRHMNKAVGKHLKRDCTVTFYDVTTYAYESQDADDLRKFGMSKDHKNNEVQVVLGLVIDGQGLPMDYDLFPGNTSEFGTMLPIIKRIKRTYSIEHLTVVADRGLNSGKNLLGLKNHDCDFVIAQKLSHCTEDERKFILDQNNWEYTLTDEDGSVLAQYKTMKKRRSIRKTRTGKNGNHYEVGEEIGSVDTTWVISYSPKRAEKDRQDREAAVKKAQDAIANGSAGHNAGHGWRSYIKFVNVENKKSEKSSVDETAANTENNDKTEINTETDDKAGTDGKIKTEAVIKPEINHEKIIKQAQWDGFYAIVTSLKGKTPQEISGIYGQLWQIERCFRISKHQLKARPVNVWTEQHVRGHFVSCYITLFVERLMEILLKRSLPASMVTPDKIHDAIKDKKLMITTTEEDKVLYCRLYSRGPIDAFFKALGLQPLNLSESIAELKYKLRIKDVVSDPTPLKPKEKMPINIEDVKPALPELTFPPPE